MKVLAIGAHFDDVELGCGGTIARHAANGDEVIIFVATNSGFTDYAQRVIRKPEVALAEGQSAARILGAVELVCANFDTNYLEFNDALMCELLKVIERQQPDFIYTHWDSDIHHDHQSLSKASMAAGRHVPRILMYRSNYYDSGKPFMGNFYVDVTAHIEQKKDAIRAHESEYRRVGEKWLKFFLNQNENDGQKIGVKYAEAFQLVKYLV
ncbi:MAG: N-acetylglycoside deacetylase, LmbE family [Stygiobacter sp.]|nr:MAG: N-acetylglycoside deacetylase, LmbE family [Stygiobacter sp.]